MVIIHKGILIVTILVVIFFLIPVVYSSTPPPPPICSYQQAGCYTKEGFAAEPNSLSADDFGYYLGENACVGTGCTCNFRGFADDLKQTNPDDSSGACECLQYGSSFNQYWYAVGKCCGDDVSDCGLVIDTSLCAASSDYTIRSWYRSEENKGDIVFAGCSNTEYLADGSSWAPCKSTGKLAVDGHDYLCKAPQGPETWIECAGSGTAYSSGDGKRLSTGESVTI